MFTILTLFTLTTLITGSVVHQLTAFILKSFLLKNKKKKKIGRALFGRAFVCWALRGLAGAMGDWQDYYDEHSDGFASRPDSEEEHGQLSGSDVDSSLAPPDPVSPLNSFVAETTELQPSTLGWGDQREFDALDALRSRSMFQPGHTEHFAWAGIDRLRDVSFNFAAFFDGLNVCYQDLLLGRVPLNSHFGRFLEYFADILGDGSLPDFYIVRSGSV